jgi:hypothetical protein
MIIDKKKYLLTLLLILLSIVVSATPIDSCAYYKRKLDTTMHQLYMSRMQINSAKFYIKICQKKPTNKKYFYGWITQRALVDKPSFDPAPIIVK